MVGGKLSLLDRLLLLVAVRDEATRLPSLMMTAIWCFESDAFLLGRGTKFVLARDGLCSSGGICRFSRVSEISVAAGAYLSARCWNYSEGTRLAIHVSKRKKARICNQVPHCRRISEIKTYSSNSATIKVALDLELICSSYNAEVKERKK